MAPPRATRRQESSQLSDADAIAHQKRQAARAAAEEVKDGMRLGLGTGSTVAYLLPALAERGLRGLMCAATSPATEQLAREQGLEVRELDELGELDLAIDGADQIDRQAWLIKGGGGAHTREKIVARAARRFVVIASAEKAVERLAPPVPVELVRFGVASTLSALAPARLRSGPEDGFRVSPDGGLIGDYHGPIGDPRELAARLAATPGVIEHGLFPPELVNLVLIAGEAGVERRLGARPEG
jgi:ribose 5-phosphate isomerase A